MEPPASSSTSSRDDGRRRDLFRYLTADESGVEPDLITFANGLNSGYLDAALSVADRNYTGE
ncbi:MAG: hypothetical protein M3Y09_02055 [Actinomycetota bacterium]|nr:hypothetical protein [Actinomycetota bacterium]MDQ2894424.1 hypothetical protein [Actinomycetota bacterium]